MHGKYAVYICEKKICVTIAELIIFQLHSFKYYKLDFMKK